MINVFAIVLVTVCSMGSFPQNNKDTLDVLSIENQDLAKIFDKVIHHEKKCDYYNDSLFFSVHLQEKEGSLNVQIEPIGNRKIQLGNEKGCIEHQGHLFFVEGKNLDSTLFSITGKSKNIIYYKSENLIDSKTGEAILDVIEDDSFSIWVYRYVNQSFVLENHHTFCR